MRVNGNFDERVMVRYEAETWRDSPASGVARHMLDRIGGEVARATSLVRFAPGSSFAAHTHDGGEEYLVLDGVFQDESGDFPIGSYVRNPPGTAHRPASADGTVIFVKLHQFDPADRQPVTCRLDPAAAEQVAGRAGVRVQPLHHDAREDVRLEVWSAGCEIDLAVPGGAEMLVLAGGFRVEGAQMAPWDWIRLPAGDRLKAIAGSEGAQVWVKTGHLANPIGLDMAGADLSGSGRQ